MLPNNDHNSPGIEDTQTEMLISPFRKSDINLTSPIQEICANYLDVKIVCRVANKSATCWQQGEMRKEKEWKGAAAEGGDVAVPPYKICSSITASDEPPTSEFI